MNKNVKKIVALALAFGTIAAVAPATNLNFLTTKAYASSTNDDETLDSIKLETSGGSSIRLYNDDDYDSDHKVDDDDVSKGDTYYAKTSASTVNIDTSGISSSYIRVFKGTSDSTKGKSESSDISLSESGTTTITIKVYSEKPDSDVRYDDSSDVLSKYIIKVKQSGSSSDSSSSTNASDYDDIYLDKLTVDGQSVGLSTSQIAYTYNVASNVNSVTILAEPQSNSDIVRINDSKVYNSDDYKAKVNLNTGVNEVKIEVEDEDNNNNRVYTLKITKAEPIVVKADQWISLNGKWVYNDSTGVPLKNTLFNDKVNNKTYYLQADGTMAMGWINTNAHWYYFGADGAMMTGWIIDNKDNKYYYLQADGTMAVNTMIGKYKVGASGAWIQ